MPGAADRSSQFFSYVDLEARVPKGHLLWTIRDLVDPVLVALDDQFAALYKDGGLQPDALWSP
ncbi:MAG: hypothetical protein KUA43_23365 [Hoeflea sp.]|nr:hypothetical protein [Alphaproteobacteria bacterium]MBU4543252.1 hypothetical protein [Alphaproteobacteria bacterium]MBU4549822.1 hypothetical protein [Alphaproteobacteria bacterium]MBV1726383.1 hypothetical protein [Hoeflea sp.]MBV1786238.1 hypothetical protein [Hoeflea sp.]